MYLKELLDRWSLSSLKFKAGFLEAEWKPNDQDKDAAWQLYIELLTRTATQALPAGAGSEAAALSSLHDLFALTRGILREPGRRHAKEFPKIAIAVLNQAVRPFTTRWHKTAEATGFTSPDVCRAFRQELALLQITLVSYTQLLAELAGVEDLS
jgi:hypothetical protein